jgi:hypothetical protein
VPKERIGQVRRPADPGDAAVGLGDHLGQGRTGEVGELDVLVELPVDWAVRVNGPEVDGMAAVGKHDRLAGSQAAGAGGGCGRGRCYPTCPTRLLGATPPAQGCGHEQYQQRE